jgi:uncharacterized repeat protein (TIGR03803 family)
MSRLSLRTLTPAFAFGAILFVTASSAFAGSETVVYNFSATGSGAYAELVYNGGRFYGTEYQGGSSKCAPACGSVFELAPLAGGGWSYSTLFSFVGGSTGEHPYGKVVFDTAGNLYGAAATSTQGKHGVVYELTPTASGPWTETIVQSLSAAVVGPTIDANGNLYVVAPDGGVLGRGGVSELTMNSDGTWSQTLLYSFTGKPDGQTPYGSLTFDTAGNLYGTTEIGGAHNRGSVYQLSHSPLGWSEKVMYSFDATHGSTPEGPVNLDPDGNLYGPAFYGVAYGGGTYNEGTVFKLTASSSGTWGIQVLHSFNFQGGDGYFPNQYLTPGGDGVFYGTTLDGGTFNRGTVYKLESGSNGQWTESIIYNFGPNGQTPQSGVTLGPGNALFGATSYGGTSKTGVIYQVTP